MIIAKVKVFQNKTLKKGVGRPSQDMNKQASVM